MALPEENGGMGTTMLVGPAGGNGTVNDTATTPTPLINVIDGSLSIKRTA